jgi:hypothetical protein
MCTGIELAALAASAGGTALSMNAQNDAASDAARAAGERARLADEFNRKAGARVSEEVNRLKSSTSEGEEKTAENDFMTALRNAAAKQSGQVSDGEMGKVSDQFEADSVASGRAIRGGNRTAARSLARVDAPFLQRVREGASAGRTASDLSVLSGEAGGQDFLQQLRASLIQPNSGQMAVGSFLTGAAPAVASRARPIKPNNGRGRVPDSTLPPGAR